MNTQAIKDFNEAKPVDETRYCTTETCRVETYKVNLDKYPHCPACRKIGWIYQ